MRRVPIPADVSATVVHEVAEAIRNDALVVLPTETVYGFAVHPDHEAAVERLRRLKQRSDDLVFTHHIADRQALYGLAAPPPPRVERLLDRFWPGPLTIVLPTEQGGSIGVRLPAHDFTRAVIRAIGPSLYLTSVNRSGQAPLVDPDAITAEFGSAIDILCDAGRPPLEQASTVARYRDGEIDILREGTLTRDEVLRAAAKLVVFVCTGNTCRSPLAEALARRAAARRLGTTDSGLLAHGIEFLSAGLATEEGLPASEGSVLVAREAGIDLERHRSRQLTKELLARADHVLCLSASHLVAVRAIDPALADRVELLDPGGAGIPDPYGFDVPEYRKARDAISLAIDARIAEWLPE